MAILELGSDLVTPPWLPLALVIVIGGVIVFLYRSMRHNIDRIEVPRRDELPAESRDAGGSDATAAAPTSPVDREPS